VRPVPPRCRLGGRPVPPRDPTSIEYGVILNIDRTFTEERDVLIPFCYIWRALLIDGARAFSLPTRTVLLNYTLFLAHPRCFLGRSPALTCPFPLSLRSAACDHDAVRPDPTRPDPTRPSSTRHDPFRLHYLSCCDVLAVFSCCAAHPNHSFKLFAFSSPPQALFSTFTGFDLPFNFFKKMTPR